MKERINSKNIMDKTITEFEEKTNTLVPHFCSDVKMLKVFSEILIKYSCAYKDIVFQNALKTINKKVSTLLTEELDNPIDILCNWNPEFKGQVEESIKPIIKTKSSKEKIK